MGMHGDYDDDFEGQMTIDDLFSPPERMVAVSNIFAHARKQMTLAEQKTFVYALSQLEWIKSPKEQSPIVRLNKKKLANILDYKSNPTDLSQNMWQKIRELARHSYIEIADRDKGIYDSGMVITRISMRKNTDYIRVKFEDEYFPLFTGLNSNYITMWSTDIFNMTNKRSVQFYELLRQMSYEKYSVGNNVFSYAWGVKAIKEMFDIPKDGKGSYMRDKGGFDRANFEKRVIEPLCEDLMKCQMIQLVIQPDGKPYEKLKDRTRNRVRGYRFYWTLSQRPAIADASEVKAIAERVDKDPQVLKVAKDIITGENKPKTSKKDKGSFYSFEQRDYNYGELERQLLNMDDLSDLEEK